MHDRDALNPGDHHVTLNGIRHYYEVRGQGPLCILVPGGPGMHGSGYRDMGGLPTFVTLLTLHPRGSGESADAPDGDYTLPAYARDLAALLDHLGREQAIILGHSHGGMIAQRFAIDFPDRVAQLILADTAANLSEFLHDLNTALARYRDQPWFADAYEAIQREWAGDYQTADEMGDLWLRELPFYFKEWGTQHEHLRTSRVFLPMRLDSLRQFNAGEALTMDLRPELARVTAPALVLVGRYDFITTPQMAEDIAHHLPDAQLIVFEHSGHLPFVEEPEPWAATIRRFVGRTVDKRLEKAC